MIDLWNDISRYRRYLTAFDHNQIFGQGKSIDGSWETPKSMDMLHGVVDTKSGKSGVAS